MNQTRSKGKNRLGSLTAKVGAVTALLLAVAALVNGGIDVYKAVAKIPTNIYDKTNNELFQRHFGKKPVFSEPVPIKSSNLTVEMLLQVYETGDLFVRYGDFQQWLPFKAPTTKTGSLFSEAFAQVPVEPSRDPAVRNDSPFGEAIVIDIDKLKQQQVQQQPKGNLIERSYVFAQMKDDHPIVFASSSRKYTQTFHAEPRYKITKYDLQLGSTNNYQTERIELSDDSKTLRIDFVLTSGPAIDRWRGWVQGILKTLQEQNP